MSFLLIRNSPEHIGMRWEILRISPEQIPTGSGPVRISSELLGISRRLPAICGRDTLPPRAVARIRHWRRTIGKDTGHVQRISRRRDGHRPKEVVSRCAGSSLRR
jgi:hypothetical protein